MGSYCFAGGAGSVFLSSPRMRLIVYLGQVLEIKVRINLRGCDVRVAKQLLYTP